LAHPASTAAAVPSSRNSASRHPGRDCKAIAPFVEAELPVVADGRRHAQCRLRRYEQRPDEGQPDRPFAGSFVEASVTVSGRARPETLPRPAYGGG
jgi:hypothetical protein